MLVLRCDSENGCSNVGDPYGQAEALFNVKTSEDQVQEIIMKGLPELDDAKSYSGICQTRRDGYLLTGDFMLSQH